MDSGTPEQLTDLLIQGTASLIQTNLDENDNEMVVQILLNGLNCFLNLIQDSSNLDELITSFNAGLVMLGYTMHQSIHRRDELNTVIYYVKLTPTGQLLRSNYHPIYIRSLMPEQQIPESFQKLFDDSDYLPNIVNVWDQGDPHSVTLLTFQKVQIHTGGGSEIPGSGSSSGLDLGLDLD